MNKSIISKGLLGVVAGFMMSGQALADPITNWDWILNAGWTDFAPTLEVVGTGPVIINPDAPTNGFDTLTWGVPEFPGGDQSSVVITNPNLDSTINADTLILTDVDMDGLWTASVSANEFIHNNNILQGGFQNLATLQLTDYFRIGPQFGPLGPPVEPVFDLAFLETTNEDDIADCSPLIQESDTACDDIFIILNPGGLNFSFSPGDGYQYFVSITQEGLSPLSDDACALFNGDSGCLALITDEGSSNSFQFFINLSARKISEPSVLALMGLGLLGLGYRRRKNKK